MLTRVEHKTQNFKEFQEFFGFCYDDNSVQYYINSEYTLGYSLVIHPNTGYVYLGEPVECFDLEKKVLNVVDQDMASKKRLQSLYFYNINFVNTDFTKLFESVNTFDNNFINVHIENCYFSNFPKFSVKKLSLKFLHENCKNLIRENVIRYESLEITGNRF